MFGSYILIILQFVGWQCIGRASPGQSQQLCESPSLVSHDIAYELYNTLGHLSSPHEMHDISLISNCFLFSLFLVWLQESEQQQVEWTHPRFTRQSAEIDVPVSERSDTFTSNSDIDNIPWVYHKAAPAFPFLFVCSWNLYIVKLQ